MKRARSVRWLFIVVLCWAGGGCGRHEESDEKKAKTAEANVTFKAGRGLQFSAATSKALGVVTTEAKERSLSSTSKLTAQVYDTGPPVLASALVPAAEADRLGGREVSGAKLLQTNHAIESATHRVELIFEVAESGHKMGDFVELALRAPAAAALAVPRSAVIDGATGTFVYVVNGDSYLRTAVKTGAEDADWIEITDGLYAGDVVVSTAALKLWLTEMLLTKGGGDID